MRPGYGYPGVEDPYATKKAPSDIGINKMDLKTGEAKLLISIADMDNVVNLGENLGDYWHYLTTFW